MAGGQTGGFRHHGTVLMLASVSDFVRAALPEAQMQAIPNDIAAQLQAIVGTGVTAKPVSGGDTCSAYHLCNGDEQWFLKVARDDGDSLKCEAENLATMAATKTVTVPVVISCGHDYLLLNYIEKGQQHQDYWHVLARQLAQMHRIEQPCFGFKANNYCGGSIQCNPLMADGYAFFSQQRIGYQGEIATRNGLLDKALQRRLEQLCRRLPALIPAQAPALLHGDLWTGNYFAAGNGLPVLVDPACYWGWPEADLAMMTLFGKPPTSFFSAYSQHAPLPPGWQQRFAIYNLYHLLNHLNLFGRSYLPAVARVLKTYG